jgi:1-acyl-sn-glycerol-3-phosphate acyltransferase
MRYMAWDALFGVPLLGSFIRSLGAFPVKLKTADKSAIERTLKVLRSRATVTIFPEGGRSFTGDLMPFEVGAFRLAVQTGATIVPVSILGMFEAWAPIETLPTLFRPVIVKYHHPIVVPANIPRTEVKTTVDNLSNEVRRVIIRRQQAFERLRKMKSTGGVWGIVRK